MNFYFVDTNWRTLDDLIPCIKSWNREDAKGIYFSWLGFCFGLREDNEIFILNESIKELKKQAKVKK